jgi:hypothetical protein
MNYEAIKQRQTELARKMLKMTMQGVGSQSPRYRILREEFSRNAYILKNKPMPSRGMTIYCHGS